MINNSNWMPFEDKWVSYDETKTYEDYMKKNGIRKDKSSNVEIEVHNRMQINHTKAFKTIQNLVRNFFKKYAKRGNWKIEFWVEEKTTNRGPEVTCGAALVRPSRSTIYAKKTSGYLRKSVRESLEVINRTVREEGGRKKRILAQEKVA